MALSFVLASAAMLAAPDPQEPTPAPSSPSAERAAESAPLPSAREPALELDDKRLLFYGLARGAGRFRHGAAGAGGSLQLGVGVRLVRGLYLQGEIGEGLFANPTQTVGTVIAGLRYEIRRWDRLRPSAMLGFNHAHRSDLEDLRRRPIATLAGFADGITHRTGLHADMTLRLPFPSHWRRPLTRLSGLVRADMAYFFDHTGHPLHLGLGAGLSVTF